MPIERITADDLRDMEHQEGLVLQGCGGEAQEWLDGINDLLTQDGILQNGSRFETVKVFQHDGLTNLLFPSRTFRWIWGNWRCGACRPTAHSAAHGCPTMFPTGWADFAPPGRSTPALSALCWGRTATSSI